jgi:peptidoglycan/LPS O-acetylase OafA/YrhL
MKENIPTTSRSEMRKNLITGAITGGMLGVAIGYGFGHLWLGIIVGFLFGLAIGYRINRVPIKMRYPLYVTRRILLAAAVLFLVGLGYAILLDHGWNGTRAILAALFPIAAWAFLVVTLGMAIASLDELQRRIQTEATAIGFTGTVISFG